MSIVMKIREVLTGVTVDDNHSESDLVNPSDPRATTRSVPGRFSEPAPARTVPGRF
jgi:hypothetical protein